MLINELREKQRSLKEVIAKLEAQMEPIQAELQKKRETLVHVEALLADETGKTAAPERVIYKRGIWAKLCWERDWPVKGDSAHRVVMRRDPKLHVSIPHKCCYDGKTYY